MTQMSIRFASQRNQLHNKDFSLCGRCSLAGMDHASTVGDGISRRAGVAYKPRWRGCRSRAGRGDFVDAVIGARSASRRERVDHIPDGVGCSRYPRNSALGCTRSGDTAEAASLCGWIPPVRREGEILSIRSHLADAKLRVKEDVRSALKAMSEAPDGVGGNR